jgi:hypothetical protein
MTHFELVGQTISERHVAEIVSAKQIRMLRLTDCTFEDDADEALCHALSNLEQLSPVVCQGDQPVAPIITGV